MKQILTYCLLIVASSLLAQTTRINVSRLLQTSATPYALLVADASGEAQYSTGLLFDGTDLTVGGEVVYHEGNVPSTWENYWTKSGNNLSANFGGTLNLNGGGLKTFNMTVPRYGGFMATDIVGQLGGEIGNVQQVWQIKENGAADFSVNARAIQSQFQISTTPSSSFFNIQYYNGSTYNNFIRFSLDNGNATIGGATSTIALTKLDVVGRISQRVRDLNTTSNKIAVFNTNEIEERDLSTIGIDELDDTGFIAPDADLLDGQQGAYYLDSPFSKIGSNIAYSTGNTGLGVSPFTTSRLDIFPSSSGRSLYVDLGISAESFQVSGSTTNKIHLKSSHTTVGDDELQIGDADVVVNFENAEKVTGLRERINIQHTQSGSFVSASAAPDLQVAVDPGLDGGKVTACYCSTNENVSSADLVFRLGRKQTGGGVLYSNTATIAVGQHTASIGTIPSWNLTTADKLFIDVTAVGVAEGLFCTIIVSVQ